MNQFVRGLGQLLVVWGSPRVKPRWFGPALSTRVHWLSPRFCLRLAGAARAWGCRALKRCWSPNREDAASNTHSTERLGLSFTPAPKPQGAPSNDFRPPSDKVETCMEYHIIRLMCSKCWKMHWHPGNCPGNVVIGLGS